MRVRNLFLDNIRNIKAARLEPSAGFNLLYGDNGAGKTTVLESLVILGKGRSFRSGTASSLIGTEKPAFQVVADLEDEGEGFHRVGFERTRERWRGRLDGEDFQQLSTPAPLFPLVLIEPTSYLLVSGSPDVRRRFLDWSVFHVKPSFLDTWRRYSRVLKQRNAALRTRNGTLVRSLDPQFIQYGEQLHAMRDQVFRQLAPVIEDLVQIMSPDLGQAAVSLKPGWSHDSLSDSLEAGMTRDLEQGITRSGPHRADVVLRVNGKAVRDRLSRGEQKILATSLILSQASLFSATGSRPIVLLDDLASEFDQHHLDQVMAHVTGLEAQHFVTGTDRSAYATWKNSSAALFHVKQGTVTREIPVL